jgi:nucleoside-diphosphate-sugar epimerase
MHVVVIGASGNVGTSVLAALADEPAVTSILGIARRRPNATFSKTAWATADVSTDDLAPHLAGADAIVHLAWLIQPSHDAQALYRTNVLGSERVFRAVADARVPALVYASSVGAYSPGPKDRAVDESWPTGGVPSSFYSRHKAETERMLDRLESEHPSLRVVRMRPGFIFKREAASGIRRLFAGPLLPSRLAHPALLPFVPDDPRLRFQAVHSLDVGDAYRRAIVRDVRGAFNVAADPILDPAELARILGARRVRLGPGVLRAAAATTWHLLLQPTPSGWIDLAFAVPILDTTRARDELGWTPRYTSEEALLEVLDGIRHRAGIDTPPLAPDSGGPLRLKELRSRVGGSMGH